jgi:hypothetical protein
MPWVPSQLSIPFLCTDLEAGCRAISSMDPLRFSCGLRKTYTGGDKTWRFQISRKSKEEP